jgi:hypothetical protein
MSDINFGDGASIVPGPQITYADGLREAARLVQIWQSFEPAKSVLHSDYNRDSSRIIGSWPARLRGQASTSERAATDCVSVIKAFIEQYPDIENDTNLSGADMIDFVTVWMRHARAALEKVGGVV